MNTSFKTMLVATIILVLTLSVNAIQSVIVTPDSVIVGGSVSCTATLDTGNGERNVAYNLTFYNTTAQNNQITGCSYTGTTENAPNPSNIVQSCVIPSNWGASHDAICNFTLVGDGDSHEGDFNITALSATSLVVTSISLDENAYLATMWGLKATVVDQNNKTVTNAKCQLYLEETVNGELNPVSVSEPHYTAARGIVLYDTLLDPKAFSESSSYSATISCFCRSQEPCFNSDGALISNASNTALGSSSVAFTTDKWLNVTTTRDKNQYGLKGNLHMCANVTNNRNDMRVPINIEYSYRCQDSAGDNSFDRIILGTHTELRGISANTTQQQCVQFTIPEETWMQARNTTCYASTNVNVVDVVPSDLPVVYATTSPQFYIYSYEINTRVDWEKEGDWQFNSIVNLSTDYYVGFSGATEVGNLDILLSESEAYATIINNLTVYNSSHLLTENTHYKVEWNEDHRLELELRGFNLSRNHPNTWYNITVNFHNWDERLVAAAENNTVAQDRQADALEGIENKTGTFHFEINVVDPYVKKGETVDVEVTAQIEIPYTGGKECKFECYIIDDNGASRSVLDWNKMLFNNTPYKVTQQMSIPNDLVEGNDYTLTCKVRHDSFGTRVDTASDSFTVDSGRLIMQAGIGGMLTAAQTCESNSQCYIGEQCFDGVCTRTVPDGMSTYLYGVIGALVMVCGAIYMKYKY